ncbi:anti-sigma factor [Adhaeribacter radiodurans]|uniref:Regulator of SigK n=1 Tax=Adhaeribacter radiodurans TaxID=2745197 RepID=A0A7L7L7S9_9BACT|nr:anti-sigma factor [Adhaeribacter radiodurans]QMU28823.1 anti-sigma factor [Adhaeribacter radiodurans]
MDIQEYIASGVLELYATGLLPPAERLEVDRMSALYPQVQAELQAISDSLDSYAQLHAVEPPAHLKEKVLRAIITTAPIGNTVAEITPEPEGKQISFPVDSPLDESSAAPGYSWWAIAATVLLLVSAGFNFYFFTNWQRSENQYQLALASQNRYAQQVQQVNNKLQLTTEELQFLTHNKTQRVDLKGVQKSPSSSVLVYWNTKTKGVLLKVADLPVPPPKRQYQLWALENGKPIDAGMLDLSDSTAVQHMKTIANAQAFAITLEPEGGSQNPTLQEMYVMGQI